ARCPTMASFSASGRKRATRAAAGAVAEIHLAGAASAATASVLTQGGRGRSRSYRGNASRIGQPVRSEDNGLLVCLMPTMSPTEITLPSPLKSAPLQRHPGLRVIAMYEIVKTACLLLVAMAA